MRRDAGDFAITKWGVAAFPIFLHQRRGHRVHRQAETPELAGARRQCGVALALGDRAGAAGGQVGTSPILGSAQPGRVENGEGVDRGPVAEPVLRRAARVQGAGADDKATVASHVDLDGGIARVDPGTIANGDTGMPIVAVTALRGLHVHRRVREVRLGVVSASDCRCPPRRRRRPRPSRSRCCGACRSRTSRHLFVGRPHRLVGFPLDRRVLAGRTTRRSPHEHTPAIGT